MSEVTEATPDHQPWLRCDPEAHINILDLKEIVFDWTIHQYVRKVAADLELSPISYTSAGSIFYSMPNSAVADFAEMVSGFDDYYLEWLSSSDPKITYRLRNITLLSFLIARCEGVPDLSVWVIQEALPNFVKLCKLESMYRKGIVKVNYHAYSLFDNSIHKPLLTK